MLRTALDMAWQEGKVADDGAWRRVKRFRNVNKARVEFLTHDEACALLASLFALNCAVSSWRRSIPAAVSPSYLQLRARDLNRQRMAIYVHPLKTYRGRHVALPEEGYAFFEELALGQRSVPRNCWCATAAFPGHQALGPAPCSRRSASRSGLSNQIVFHSLRHTYASWLIQAGTPVVVVARQLGHSNINTVVRTYAHCADDFYDEELRKRYQTALEGQPRPPARRSG
jgi:integrase/recombinase XerD